jgi:hypothetical protein
LKASITIALETVWTNSVELRVEADMDNPHSEATKEIVSGMFDAVQQMVEEARAENERMMFSQGALNDRHRELDEREARLDEREARVGVREAASARREGAAVEREEEADVREREQMEREVHQERQD